MEAGAARIAIGAEIEYDFFFSGLYLVKCVADGGVGAGRDGV